MTPNGIVLVRFGVADDSECGRPLWERLGGAEGAKPAEPWCAASLDAAGIEADPAAYQWLADFESVLAWAWLTGKESA